MKIKIFLTILLVIFVSVEEGDFAATEAVKCEGKDCDKKVKECQVGFWGDSCKTKCDCDGRADSCDFASGKCFCKTKGVIGDKCDKCDEKKLYKGDPINGNCYYDLFSSIFVMKLTSPANKFITDLNFKFSPEDPKDDIIFTIHCSQDCDSYELSMMAKEDGKEPKVVIDKEKVKGSDKLEKVLSHKEFKFGMEKEKPFTEFLIHVNNFKTPTIFEINVLPESKQGDTFVIAHYES